MGFQINKKIIVSILISTFLCLLFPAVSRAATINKPTNSIGMVGYWTLDGKDINWGTNKALDRSGNGNDANLLFMSTTTSPLQGKIGQALYFYGNSVSLSGNATINNLSTLTYSAWVMVERGPQNQVGRIIVKDISGSDSSGTILQFNTSVFHACGFEGVVGFGTTNAYVKSANYCPSGTITLSGWHHVAFTVDGNKVPRMYVDGVESVYSQQTTGVGTHTDDSAGQLIIGNSIFGTRAFNNPVDDIRVYNRALSAAEVNQLYKQGSAMVTSPKPAATGLSSGLVGYWTLDGKDISWVMGTTTDRSGNGNNGSLINWSTTTSPTQGKVGQGLNFNGSNQKIDLGNASSVQLSNGTISAWIKTANAGSSFRGIAAKQFAYGMFLNANEFGMYDWGSSNWRGSGYSPNDNKWHLLTCTFQSGVSNGTFCYADGVLRLTTTMTINGQGVMLQIAEANASQYFNGSIDDVRVYNRVLSSTEVRQLYNLSSAKFDVAQKSAASGANSGLVGYWTFDGKDISWAGGTTTDRSGLGNNLNLANMSTTTAPVVGKFGQALSYNGINRYAYSGGVFSDLGTSNRPYSFSAWVKVPTGVSNGNIIHMSSGSTGSGWCLAPVALESGKLRGYSWNTGPVSVLDTTNIVPNVWQHVVITWDATNGLRIFVNGVLKNTTSMAAYIASGSSNYIWLGFTSAGCSGDSGYFNGSIDEVRIYNRALTATDVLQLYNSGR